MSPSKKPCKDLFPKLPNPRENMMTSATLKSRASSYFIQAIKTIKKEKDNKATKGKEIIDKDVDSLQSYEF